MPSKTGNPNFFLKENEMKILKKIGLLGAPLALTAANASAALPESVTNAISSASTDSTSAGWLVVGVFAAIFAVKLVLRVIR